VIASLRVFAEEAKESFAEGFPRGAVAAPVAPATASRADASPRGDAPHETLRSIRQDIGDCRRCTLAKGRTHIVFGVGNPAADVMFVGEGPGEDEDRKGEPFVGRAGQLLTDIITNGMGLSRSDVYIANVVKCRPPGNRNPEPDEIAACKPFLLSQIDAVAPRVIVALGKFAAHTLLETTAPISKLRGRWFDFRGRRLMPTFHPSYLLRTPSEKKLAWEDIKLVMQALALPLPKTAKPQM
jgi:DNA polymerase